MLGGDDESRVAGQHGRFRVDYLRKGLCEDLHCEAKLIRLGRSVAVARMEVFPASNREHVIATGQGVYNLVYSVKTIEMLIIVTNQPGSSACCLSGFG